VAVKRRTALVGSRAAPGAALSLAARSVWHEWREAALAARRRPDSRRSVHRFRIATRRLLAIEELLTNATLGHPVRKQLEPAFHAAGHVRNVQVGSARLDSLADRSGAARAISRTAEQRLPALVRRFSRRLESLDRKELRHAVRRLRHRACPADNSPVAERAQARAVASALSRYEAARQQLESAAHGIAPDSADSAVHALRLKLKRVRYMRELLAPPGAYGTRTVQSLANWQRSLGAIADQRTMLRLIDRPDAWPGAHADAFAALRNRLLRAERRRIAALVAPHGRRPRGLS
jgi:CHAD domain-containing protein